MNFFGNALVQAWQLVISGDPTIVHLVIVTLQVALVATIVGLVLGVPLGLLLGLGRFAGRRVAVALANSGLGAPPVVVGLILFLLMFPRAPLGSLHLLFTLEGVYVAQAILAIPVVIALTASAVRSISPGLLDQARAFGASRLQVWVLAVREARVGILAATIAAVGGALSEVGAVVLVGGNVEGADQTLASSTLELVNGGRYTEALAVGIVLIVLIIVVSGLLTAVQYWDGRRTRQRTSR